MTVWPNANLLKPINDWSVGAAIKAFGDDYRTYIVKIVRAGSPSDKAGVRVDDQLMQINGVETRTRCLSDLWDEIKGSALEHWVVRRNGKLLNFTIQPEDSYQQVLDFINKTSPTSPALPQKPTTPILPAPVLASPTKLPKPSVD